MGIMIVFFIFFALSVLSFKDAMDKGKLELFGLGLIFSMITVIVLTKVIEEIWIF